MTKTIFGCAALIALSLVPAAGVAQNKKPADPNRKVCRTESTTGSMMDKRICHTASDWAGIDAANAEATRTMRDHMNGGGMPR